MAKKRANGEGSIRKRKDGRWEGRYTAGHTPEGKAIYRNVLGKTQAEVVEKLRKAIEETKGLDVAKIHPGPVDAGVVRELRHHQGTAQLPRNVQRNHQKPH